jgi:hypothetical protein
VLDSSIKKEVKSLIENWLYMHDGDVLTILHFDEKLEKATEQLVEDLTPYF